MTLDINSGGFSFRRLDDPLPQNQRFGAGQVDLRERRHQWRCVNATAARSLDEAMA